MLGSFQACQVPQRTVLADNDYTVLAYNQKKPGETNESMAIARHCRDRNDGLGRDGIG
jgi:hypothetical protein